MFRSYQSEYATNYQPPKQFEYEDGAWKGADPPQLKPTQVSTLSQLDNADISVHHLI